MVPNLLVQEIVTALVGGAGVWSINMLNPLQDSVKRVLTGGVILTTVYLMGRFGGLW